MPRLPGESTVVDDEDIGSGTKGKLVFGKDVDGKAKAVGITGAESDETKIISDEIVGLLEKILMELTTIRIHMELITDNEIEV